jgi:CBS domain-containing protein
MTPEPETALPDTSILQALKQMHGKKKMKLVK